MADYVAHLKNELEQKILEIGPQRVAAFMCEPVVGAVSLNSSPFPFSIRTEYRSEDATSIVSVMSNTQIN